MICSIPNNKQYKRLLDHLGGKDGLAFLYWNVYKGVIPESFYETTEKQEEEAKPTPTQEELTQKVYNKVFSIDSLNELKDLFNKLNPQQQALYKNIFSERRVLIEKDNKIIQRIQSFKTIDDLEKAWNSKKFSEEDKAKYKKFFTLRKEGILLEQRQEEIKRKNVKQGKIVEDFVNRNKDQYIQVQFTTGSPVILAKVTGKMMGLKLEVATSKSNFFIHLSQVVNNTQKGKVYETPQKGKYYQPTQKSLEERERLKQEAAKSNTNIDIELANKLQNKLEKLYPEIKLNITNKPIWEKNALNQKEFKEEINYQLKSIDILLSDKANEIFEKGKKNNWDLNKILTELQIPKNQKDIILNLNTTEKEKIVTDLISNSSYVINIKTAKGSINPNAVMRFNEDEFSYNGNIYNADLDNNSFKENGKEIDFSDFNKILNLAMLEFDPSQNSNYYSDLIVPGGTNYTENEISTPAITPSIKGHAQFATPSGIGWFRADESQQYQETDIQSIIDNLQKSGQLEINCK